MRYLSILLTLFISLNAFADNVRILNPQDLVVNGLTDTSFLLNVDEPSGDATAEGSPARVYVPLTNTTVPDHDKYFYLYSPTGPTVLFNTGDATDVVKFPLTVTPTGTKYLYAAAKSTAAGYKVIQKYSTALTSTQDLYFDVSANAICVQYAADCTTLAPTQATSTKGTFKIYFYLSTSSNLPLGDTVDPAVSTGGVYFEVVLSNKVYTNLQLKVFATNPRKGDRRILFDYTSDNSMLDFKKILIFNHSTNAPVLTNEPIGSYSGAGSLINRDFSTTQEGTITLNELTNNVEATVSVAFMDKFGFASTLSDDISETPLEIQELLKKNSCFLLTAGFGEEHYIINYFRYYRDHVLAKSWLGQKFIKVYYRSAPHYAGIIYQSESMRFSIRIFAYILYFFFNFSWVLIVIFSSCYFLNLRKNKIILPDNGL